MGGLWLVLVPPVVIPYFASGRLGIGYYPQLAYDSHGGGTLKGMWQTLWHDPLALVREILACRDRGAEGQMIGGLPLSFVLLLAALAGATGPIGFSDSGRLWVMGDVYE